MVYGTFYNHFFTIHIITGTCATTNYWYVPMPFLLGMMYIPPLTHNPTSNLCSKMSMGVDICIMEALVMAVEIIATNSLPT